MLGIRLVHSKPYSPEGRGKQERLNRYIRERFFAEAEHAGHRVLGRAQRPLQAWAEQVANRRIHAETNADPDRPLRGRRAATAPPTRARLREAFRWSATRRVTKTATVSL